MLTGQALVDTAVTFAKKVHEGQTRDDHSKSPYIGHPMAVAGLFATHWWADPEWSQWTEGPFKTDYCKGLALCHLHDSIEDLGATWDDLHAAGLGFLEDELRVLTCGKEQSYLAYLLAIKEYFRISVLPWLVKLCDVEHNRANLYVLASKRRAKWLATKYEMADFILRQP